MKGASVSRRENIRAMLADLRMPGALEAVDGLLSEADSGAFTTAETIEKLLGAQIQLRNNRRLQTAMRSSRLPAVKTLEEFDFSALRGFEWVTWTASIAPELVPQGSAGFPGHKNLS